MPVLRIREKSPFKEINVFGKTVKTDLVFLQHIFKKLKNGYSPIVAICGSQRAGKSFVAVWLSYMMLQLTDKDMKIQKYTFYEPLKVLEKLEHLNKEPLIVDEASDILDYTEWYQDTHKALRSMINTQAYKTMLYIIVTPFLTDVNKSIRKHFDFYIKVKDRGKNLAFKFRKKYDARDQNRATYPVFLDSFSLTMKTVPKEIWKEYKEFSYEEKDNIRKKRKKIIEAKKMKQMKQTDAIHQTLRGMI